MIGIGGEALELITDSTNGVSFSDSNVIAFRSQQACTNIVIMGTDGEVGRLSWDDGQFAFSGDMAESAKIFFDNFLKPLVDNYIENERAGFDCIDCPL